MTLAPFPEVPYELVLPGGPAANHHVPLQMCQTAKQLPGTVVNLTAQNGSDVYLATGYLTISMPTMK